MTAVAYTLDRILADLGKNARVRDANAPRLLLYRTKRLAEGRANRTCNADIATLRACFNWARASGFLSVNPIEHIRPLPETEDTHVKRRRALSDDEIANLIRAAIEEDRERASRFAAERTIAAGVLGRGYAARKRMVPIPQAPLWKFLVVTGIRYGEAASLRWSDVDDDEGTVTIRAENAKSRRTRVVPVPGYVMDDLRDLRQISAFACGRVPENGGLVFLSPKHRPLDPHGNPARILLRRLLDRAGIAYRDEEGSITVDIHALRRTAGTRLARHAVPLATVSAILGHSDVRLTQRFYVDLRIADTRKAIEAVPEICVAARSRAPGATSASASR